MAERTVVVVGGGLAGGTAVHQLRERGFDGRLVLVGDEPHRPYERPPLSKGLLTGTATVDSVFVDAETWYADHEVDLRTGASAVELDPGRHEVRLGDGSVLRYDAALLATGARPRALPVPGADLAGVTTLRRLDDALALRSRLTAGEPVAIVGAGWIGLEVAAAARGAGCPVTVVEMDSAPLRRVLGEEMAAQVRRLHEDHGVRFRFGERVSAIVGGGAAPGTAAGVRTSSGDVVEAATVLVAVGVQPIDELARAAGLAVSDGVHTDALLRTSAPDVFAAGDVALAEHPRLGRAIRVEHWATALRQGRAVAASMLGQGEPYAREPYFFTDQYDWSMEFTGLVAPGGYDELCMRGDPGSGEYVAFWLADNRVLAGMNVNVWDVADAIETLVASGRQVEPKLLADPTVPLDEVWAA